MFFILYFARFALSFDKLGGTLEVKIKKTFFILYFARFVNPAKRKATPIKNEKRFSEQKRKAMKIIKAIPEIVSPLLLHC